MNDQRGFTLMEALVAVAVFATAAMGLISLNTNSIRISAQLGDRTLARLVAENIAVSTVTDAQLQVVGRTAGEASQRRQTFEWERTITPAQRADLIQISIRVKLKGEEESILSELTLLHRSERAP
ncbi:general secretion pathway protein I [Hyphomonas neptunium ATCC 15444]|uniref:Type II secretion system protein I n=2 Tax=Hyphomonas TaxID=85 RepID=Q0C122_HYPNA|nr:MULTISPECIES: type II secretion system minor pseudopilin GspI [Hyphomonas]ABI75876.1 general secretion pathway protein I [Hyphomonas neptunium ATCC 15444]KCZ95014.1 general secretion pathway protein I [Hyphomonas hirschiana VP5]